MGSAGVAGPGDLAVGGVRGQPARVAGRGVTVVEEKLCRNPDARRKVIGQILDYASALANMRYVEHDAEVREASPGDDRGISACVRWPGGAACRS